MHAAAQLGARAGAVDGPPPAPDRVRALRPKSLVLLLLSSLKDAAVFLRDNESLFMQKIRYVVLMSGAKVGGGGKGGRRPSQKGAGLAGWPPEGTARAAEGASRPASSPPDDAQNNEFDRPAARFFYRRCQELGVPLIIVASRAANGGARARVGG